MDCNLLSLLHKCHEPNDKNFTHISMYGPNSKWNIPDNNYCIFWNGYCEMIKNNPEGEFCLAEMAEKHMPVMVDCTFKFHPISKEYYNDDFIAGFIYCYQTAIERVFKISSTKRELYCCVLASENYLEDNLAFVHIKLQFPFCKTLPSDQSRILRPLALQLLRTENVISKLDHQPVNNWETIIDPLSGEKPTLLYGSKDKPNIPCLDLIYIIDFVYNDNENLRYNKFLELEQIFDLTEHNQVISGIVPSSMFCDNSDLEFWLPMFLSINYCNNITVAKFSPPEALSRNLKISQHSHKISAQPTFIDQSQQQELEIIEMLHP